MALLSWERRAGEHEWGRAFVLTQKYRAESCREESGQRARHAPPISHAFFSSQRIWHRTPL